MFNVCSETVELGCIIHTHTHLFPAQNARAHPHPARHLDTPSTRRHTRKTTHPYQRGAQIFLFCETSLHTHPKHRRHTRLHPTENTRENIPQTYHRTLMPSKGCTHACTPHLHLSVHMYGSMTTTLRTWGAKCGLFGRGLSL